MPTLFEAKQKSSQKSKRVPPIPSASSHVHPFSCYVVRPDELRFETQEPDEDVILFMRQHLVTNVPWVILSIVLILAPSVIIPFLFTFLHLPIPVPASYIVIGTLFWYLATAGFIIVNFLQWYFNIYIVTNHRIVDIDFVQLLFKRFSEARLSKIQDVSYETSGVFAAVFNFGDVHIQTAGEMPEFEFASVPNPDKVVTTISELVKQEEGL
ncbi:PH domain-containing protein [Candidatus Gottesmanbacteria bacterium]|nr:PH domain-containing protein [Candidatus Gottesmanbacteria bacterium]